MDAIWKPLCDAEGRPNESEQEYAEVPSSRRQRGHQSNWELSAARATGVTRYLVEDKHVSPLRISLAGYGEYRPRVDNSSPQQRRFNRRVDIVVLNAATTKADQAVQP
jgi:hypothetical protein